MLKPDFQESKLRKVNEIQPASSRDVQKKQDKRHSCTGPFTWREVPCAGEINEKSGHLVGPMVKTQESL